MAMALETLEMPRVRKLTLDDVLGMVDAGIIDRHERVELVDGVLVSMSPESFDHADLTVWLNRLCTDVYAAPVQVRVNTTFPLSGAHNYRIPDFVITAPVTGRWADGHEVVLAIEVAKTSRATDLGPKALQYAAFGASTYWVVDLVAGAVVVHTQPSERGYGHVVSRTGDDEVAFPQTDRVVRAVELLTLPPL